MAAKNTVITVTMNTAIDRVLKVPGFEVGGHLQAELVSQTPAGKGVNLAHALAGLMCQVTVAGFVGQADSDRFDQSLRDHCGEHWIKNRLTPVVGSTRRNLTLLDPEAGTETHLRLPGFEVTAKDVSRLAHVIRELAGPESMFVFTGSRPQGMTIAGLIDLIQVAQRAGARIVLDLNGPDLKEALLNLNHVWMVSPNRDEFCQAVGVDESLSIEGLVDAARSLPNRAEYVLLSLGEGGALLITQTQALHAALSLDSSRIVSTVGAGDSLLAGVISAIAEGGQAALQMGVTAAGVQLIHGRPWRYEDEDTSGFSVECRSL